MQQVLCASTLGVVVGRWPLIPGGIQLLAQSIWQIVNVICLHS